MLTVETHCAFFFLLRARRIPPEPIPIEPGNPAEPIFLYRPEFDYSQEVISVHFSLSDTFLIALPVAGVIAKYLDLGTTE